MLKQLGIYIEKMKLDSLFHTVDKNQHQFNYRPNREDNTVNFKNVTQKDNSSLWVRKFSEDKKHQLCIKS